MRPKNVILLEINIVVTNINDVDLLYYFARRFCPAPSGMVHHGGRGTVLAAVIEPTRAILSRFSQSFLLPDSNTLRKMAPFRLPALELTRDAIQRTHLILPSMAMNSGHARW